MYCRIQIHLFPPGFLLLLLSSSLPLPYHKNVIGCTPSTAADSTILYECNPVFEEFPEDQRTISNILCARGVFAGEMDLEAIITQLQFFLLTFLTIY